MKTLLASMLLSVSVFGASPFTIAVLPDPQTYTRYYPEVLYSQIEWIADNQSTLDIRFVINEGDSVHYGVNDYQQWEFVSEMMGVLDGVIPYIMAVGNHDMGLYDNPTAWGRSTYMFNQFFGVDRFKNEDWYGGHAENDNDNCYATFVADGVQFLVINLEFAPTDYHLEWANQIVSQYPSHFVIVVTHAYLGDNGYLLANDRNGVNDFNLPDGNDGQEIWDKLVSQHRNIHMVLCGHVHGFREEDCANYQVSIGVHGNEVHEILSNFQTYFYNGGIGRSGFLRLLSIDVSQETISVSTHSPSEDSWLTSPEHEFEFYAPLRIYRKPKGGVPRSLTAPH